MVAAANFSVRVGGFPFDVRIEQPGKETIASGFKPLWFE